MWRQVPNLLTTGRLVLACVFFTLLSWYQYEGRGDPTLLNVAFAVYAVALFTDWLDGYLARRWQSESRFGRIVDPFVDKVLVLGAFIFFAGKNFIIPAHDAPSPAGPFVVRTITGVAPAMVVAMLARELLVTSFRGASEGGGQNFGAMLSGKLKMTLQSLTILVILVYVNYRGLLLQHGWEPRAAIARDVFIWLTLGVTVLSGLLYVRKAAPLLRATAT